MTLSIVRKALKAFLIMALAIILLNPIGIAWAQENKDNWMSEYVELRTNAKNLRVVEQEDLSMSPPELSQIFGPRIVGGTDAGPNDNPFQVGLLRKAEPDNFRAQFCGGTLIRPNIVVTAAHCSDFITADQVQVLTGTRRLDDSGVRHDVAKISIHPEWNDVTFDNDVAVWQLSSNATGVPLATLATEDGPVGANLLASGWGTLSQGGRSPIDLQAVEVPLVSRTNCNDSNSYNGEVTETMLCAGFDEGGKDSCQGDSGGPLTRGENNGVLTGITSWGFGCAQPNLFGVYARVSKDEIQSFIQSNTGESLYQLHNSGAIWEYTGIPCDGNSCPGWQRLDNNVRTRAIIAAGNNLYQLHNSGAIWEYTGTPCDGNSCPGWRRLDNNVRTRAIIAAGDNLYQLHNSGAIWEYTGTPCDGNSCPGWRRLDNNVRTRAIIAAGDNLYQLHNSGAIWEYTGTPCDGNSCPGWRRLDNNPRTESIIAAGDSLYQLHNSGAIWEYTGTPCDGNSCPGWRRLDNNPRTESIIAAGDSLYQLHNSGAIWEYTGTPCDGNSCPGWQRLDNNPRTESITAASDKLYQRHNRGSIWEYTGTPCDGNSCPGWQRLDNNPRTASITSPADF